MPSGSRICVWGLRFRLKGLGGVRFQGLHMVAGGGTETWFRKKE